MNIKIDGKNKEFKINFISAKMLKKTIELQEKAENDDLGIEILDEMAEYIVDIYGNKFTIEQFWEGVDVEDIGPIFFDAVKTVMNKFKSKLDLFPKNQTGEKAK